MPRLQARRDKRGPSRRTPHILRSAAYGYPAYRVVSSWAILAMPPALRHKAGCPSGQRERSVKPSAQPTLVRTQHLPPPAETARQLRILALAGRFFSVPACVTLERCRSSYCAVHGRIADGRPCCKDGRYAQLRRSVCTVLAVGAHRRLFTDGHGRVALTAFSGLKVNGGAGRASPAATRRPARLPRTNRPN